MLKYIGVIMLAIGLTLNINLFWFEHPEKSVRLMYIEHTSIMRLITSLESVGTTILCVLYLKGKAC